jgi:plastocyanin
MFAIAMIIALLCAPLPQALAQEVPGIVTVHVLYRGTLPPPLDIKVTRDPEICGTTVPVQSVLVHSPSGGLQHAVVLIEGVHAPKQESTRMLPVILSNSRCAFSPHVMALPTGSPLEIHNQDSIMHNTHISKDASTFINVAMVAHARPVTKRVEKSGLYEVRCDAHKFMRGYVVASEHPYFGVTDEQGLTRILNVPAGEHDISVWHERLGQLRAHVTVPPNGEVAATFEFHQDGADHGLRINK